MKLNYLSIRLFLVLLTFGVLQACVEDDDFDAPQIPYLEDENEVISEGGQDAEFLSCLVEGFSSYNEDQTNFAAFENVATYNTRLWSVQEFGGNQYLQLSAYNASDPVVAYFLVPVNFDEADGFSFKTNDGYYNGDVLEVHIVTDYQIADNIATATMENITSSFTISGDHTDGYGRSFVESGKYEFGSRTGNGFIAFKYYGAGNTTTMQIDDIQILDAEDDTCEAQLGGQVSKGGSEATPTNCLTEDFTSYDTDVDEFVTYENVSLNDGRFWNVREFGGNKYLQYSAFKADKVQDGWFIIPIDFDQADTFSFETKDGFNTGNALTVLYSTSHSVGSEIDPTTWTDITSNFTLATGTTNGYATEFTASGDFDLKDISGKGFIAFRYVGDPNGVTTTMQVDNISIVDKDDANCAVSEAVCSSQDFESFAKDDMVLSGYQNINDTGDLSWAVNEFDSNKYLQMSAFGSTGAESAWFILGADFDSATSFSFETKDGYNNGNALSVHYSTDYNEGGDPSTATWTDITSSFTIASGSTGGYADAFTPSGSYSLADLTGKGYIAFKYFGDKVNGPTTTIQIDNILFNNADGSACTFDLAALGGGSSSSNLYISEYAEGSGNNKYVEIYNGTGSSVDLSEYKIWRISNGGDWPEASLTLSGTLEDGKTYVIASNSSTLDQTIKDKANVLDGIANWNGDDAVGLAKNDVLIDQIGTNGADPGSGWEVAGVANATANHTLIRKSTITQGTTDWSASAGTDADNSQWIVKDSNYWDNLGIR